MEVVWLAGALDDLEEVRAYIARHEAAAADRVHIRIVEAVATLAELPQRGRPGRVAGTRELIVPGTRYIVAYRITIRRVEILAVIHHARMWPDSF